jgi:UTP-glucose-1-phosphate uridylyltransferase
MIGIIPCAGHATRLHGLPKYLLPLGDSYLLAILVRRMFAAGVSRVYIGANSENYDLVERYVPDGCTVYLVNSKTMSETVLAGRKYAGDSDVLFGMPDSWWEDDSVYTSLALEVKTNPIVAALFAARPEQKAKLGLCEVLVNGITRVVDKPAPDRKEYEIELAWGALAWKAEFWQFILPSDPHVGFAMQRAIDHKVRVKSSYKWKREYWDCGTFNEYAACIANFVKQEATASQEQGVTR